MENQNQEEDSRPERGGAFRSWILVAIFALLTLLIVAGMSAIGGARAGWNDRYRMELTQIADESQAQIQEQSQLAQEDMQAGRYDLARQRLEWIIQQNPNHPGVAESLSEVILLANITATSTPAPTPTLTPTPDTRSFDELYQAARQAMASREWTEAIEALLNLRKADPDYQPVEVDGWLYIALRYRGLDKIKAGDLEGGTYDLALAERFGPLDYEATNYRSWAELYITGASFWDVDWEQAIYYFGIVRSAAPYLMDYSRLTSLDRYRLALTNYGDWFSAREMWCEAKDQYLAALEAGAGQAVENSANEATEQCDLLLNPEDETEESGEATPTPTP
jgi:tetratricopeptide (TPR) repeat protein